MNQNTVRLYFYLPVNNFIVVSTPNLQTVTMARRYVTYYMHFLSTELCTLKLIYKPLKLFCRVCAVQQQPPSTFSTNNYQFFINKRLRIKKKRIYCPAFTEPCRHLEGYPTKGCEIPYKS